MKTPYFFHRHGDLKVAALVPMRGGLRHLRLLRIHRHRAEYQERHKHHEPAEAVVNPAHHD